jgi:hypothetical protein
LRVKNLRLEATFAHHEQERRNNLVRNREVNDAARVGHRDATIAADDATQLVHQISGARISTNSRRIQTLPDGVDKDIACADTEEDIATFCTVRLHCYY